MTPDDLTATVARLRELAAKATPGPWQGWAINGPAASGPPRGDVVGPARVPYDHGLLFGPADALFIAACHPQTVLALCDAVVKMNDLQVAIVEHRSEYLQSEFGKCADFDPNCEGCKRWVAFNVIFPEQS